MVNDLEIIAFCTKRIADAAAFFMGVGNRAQLAVELAKANWKLRDTPRSRSLLAKAKLNALRVSRKQRGAA
jgi:hypothetical protein